jgi:hypothetical protein
MIEQWLNKIDATLTGKYDIELEVAFVKTMGELENNL